MIRTVITPDHQNISIRVPKTFIGKRVEVIAFTIEDSMEGIVQEPETDYKPLTHYASEKVLAKEWSNPEEDKAWEDL